VILVDTSVWINHREFRRSYSCNFSIWNRSWSIRFVVGEAFLRELGQSQRKLSRCLHSLPAATKADDDEILFFIERHRLMGRGLGLVDMHLLASATIAGDLDLDGRQGPPTRRRTSRNRVSAQPSGCWLARTARSQSRHVGDVLRKAMADGYQCIRAGQ